MANKIDPVPSGINIDDIESYQQITINTINQINGEIEQLNNIYDVKMRFIQNNLPFSQDFPQGFKEGMGCFIY